MQHTDDELIKRGLEIRDDIDAIKKAHSEELEPYETALQDIENALLARLNERGTDKTGGEHGTAYKSKQIRVKVADRLKWLGWLEDHIAYLSDFITNHVSKEAVKAYMEEHNGTVPDGIDTTTFTQCNIRKA